MSLFESLQSKVMLGLGVPVILITQIRSFDMTQLLTQLILFLALAYNTDCLVVGRCHAWAWLTLLFPLIMVIGFVFFSAKLNLQPPFRIPTTTVTHDAQER